MTPKQRLIQDDLDLPCLCGLPMSLHFGGCSELRREPSLELPPVRRRIFIQPNDPERDYVGVREWRPFISRAK